MDFDQQQQEVKYKVTVDRSDLYQAVDEIERLGSKAAGSISSLSSNMLGNIAGTQATAAMGSSGFMPGSALAPGMMASALYAQQSGFAPGAALAQDAYMQQVMAAGPSQMGSFRPSLTTPFGDPTIDLFRSSRGAAAFQVPTDFLAQSAPPGAPGDPGRSRLVFGTGEGSVWNMARIAGGLAIHGKVTNDNLEDRMIRNIERRTQYFADNLRDAERFLLGDVGGGMLGTMAGGAVGTAFGGPAGTVVGSVLGGVLGSAGGAAVDATIGQMARPYEEITDNFRQYTAPFVRGERVGGGTSYRESFQVQREMADRIAEDNWFTSSEFKDMVNIAGESGVFQFTGTKERALEAVDKLGDSVKALYALGIKSRDMLKAVDQSLGTLGISATSPQQMANFFQTMAITAQSAGVSTSRMADMVAPAAQMFASQGIGMQAGARIAAQNFAIGGGLFRSGAMGAFENAYYGGSEGYGQTLTQATATMYRSPVGQSMLASLFAPGGENLKRLLGGNTLSVNDIVTQAGAGASSDPLNFLFKQIMMPRLTQNLGTELQDGMLQTMLQTFKEQSGEQGQVSPERFVAWMQQVTGMPESEAAAVYDRITNATEAASDLRRSAHDNEEMARLEQLRAPTLTRQGQKFYERTLGRGANAMMAGLGEFNAGIMAGMNEWITGIHTYDVGDMGRQASTPFGQLRVDTEAREILEQGGYKPDWELQSSNQRALSARSQEEAAREVFATSNTAKQEFIDLARKNGVADKDIQGYIELINSGTATTRLDAGVSRELAGLAGRVTGQSGTEAIAGVANDAAKVKAFTAEATKLGIKSEEVKSFLAGGSPLVPMNAEARTQLVGIAEGLTQAKGSEAIAAISGNDLRVRQLQEEATKKGIKAADVEAFLGDGMVVQPEMDPVRKTKLGMALAAVLPQDPNFVGEMEAFSSLRGRSRMVDQEAQRLGQDLVKQGLASEEEVKAFLTRGLKPSGDGVFGNPHEAHVSPEKMKALNSVFQDQVYEKYKEFQIGHMGLIGGLQATMDGDEDLRAAGRQRATIMFDALGGKEGVRKRIKTSGGFEGRKETVENFAKEMFDGKSYDELDERQQRELGAAIRDTYERFHDGSAEQYHLLDFQTMGVGAGSSEKFSLQALKKERDDLLKGVGDNGIRDALKQEGADGRVNAQLIKQAAIAQMASESKTSAEFEKKLAAADITKDQAEKVYGVNFSAFAEDPADVAKQMRVKLQDELGKLPEAKRKALSPAIDTIQRRGSWFGLGEFDEGQAYKWANQLDTNTEAFKSVESMSIDAEAMDYINRRTGGSGFIGKKKLSDLVERFNADARSSSVDGLTGLLDTLSTDSAARGNLGVSEDYLDAMTTATKRLSSGQTLSVDDLAGVISQTMGISMEDARKQAEGLSRNITQQISEGHGVAAQVTQADMLRTSMQYVLEGRSSGQTAVGNRATGGIVDDQAVKAMVDAASEQRKVASRMEDLAKQFSAPSMKDWTKQVEELNRNIGKESSPLTEGAEKFSKAVDELFSGKKPMPVKVVETGVKDGKDRKVEKPQWP